MDQRDEQEFAEYFTARRDAVRRSAFLLCGDWHRADDLAQHAFVALHRHWNGIRDRGALDAYVRRSLVRAVIDESRRPWRRERFTDAVPETSDVAGGAAEIGEAVQNFHQLADIIEVQAGGGLVEQVEGASGLALGKFSRQLHTLGLAAGKGGG